MLAGFVFAAGAVVSLLMSWLLVTRLERVGERLGLSEALLGIVAALAADAPEITAAVSAISSHQQRIGAGVVLGSNVFNLAALLGLGAVVAGRIGLHRKVVVLGGVVAVLIAGICGLSVGGLIAPLAGLLAAVLVLAAYLLVLGGHGGRLGLPARWQAWLRSAVTEEESELEDAIRPGHGRWPDVLLAGVALVVVVAASVTMERAASSLGTRLAVPEIITGGLVLAAVTSLPNAVAAVYLASRGRGAATLSTALNSNALNVVAGLLLPGAILGLGHTSGQAMLVTVWYAGLTLAVLALAWQDRGISRQAGLAIIAAYGAFTASMFLSGGGPGPRTAIVMLTIGAALVLGLASLLTVRVARSSRRPGAAAMPARQLQIWAGQSLVPGWPVRRLVVLSMTVTALVAAVDAATGHRVILIGLLIAGPCIAQLTGRWQLTAVAGLWACGLAVVLGLPDQIWITSTHVIFMIVVAVVTIVATACAALTGWARNNRCPS